MIVTRTSPFSAASIGNGAICAKRFTSSLSRLRPIIRLIAKIVLAGFVTAWRFAIWPTSFSPEFENATIDGVVREPSEFAMICVSPFS